MNFTYLLAQVRKNRGYVKYGGNLSKEDIEFVWKQQDGKCPVTGVALVLPTRSNIKQISSIYRASVDRLDNSLGYEKSNIRIVSLMYNFARNTSSETEVVEFCRLVMENIK